MFGVVEVTVLAISVACGIGALATAAVAFRQGAKHDQEHQEGQHTAALAQLDKWRHTGVLVMSDRDYELAAELGTLDPEQLDGLVEFVQRIIDEELGPKQRLKLTVQVVYEEKPKSTLRSGLPSRHLELIAAFS